MGSFLDKLLGRRRGGSRPERPAPSPRPVPPPEAVVPEGYRRSAAAGPGLAEWFTHDHRECDEAWAEVEAAVEAQDGAAAQAAWQAFSRRMHRHLSWEEDVLFPAVEAATGMSGMGPTAIMRSEHEQMRQVMVAGEDALVQGDLEALLDLGDTLMMLVQQHNVKEEGMLYPMAEQQLAATWPELQQRLTD